MMFTKWTGTAANRGSPYGLRNNLQCDSASPVRAFEEDQVGIRAMKRVAVKFYS